MPAPARRPSRFADDYDGLLALMTAVAEHDGDGIEVVPDDVRLEFVDEEPGWVRDHTVWEAADGTLAAYAAVWHEPSDPDDRAYADLGVHPAHRGRALEDEVAATLLASTREVAAKPVALRLGAKASQAWKTGMLERAGMAPDRHFHRMRRPLAEPNAPAAVAEGYTVRPIDLETELPAWCAAFEEAFAENYDPPRMSVDERRNYVAKVDHLPSADLVAVAPDGEIAGLTWGYPETRADGSVHGWIWYIAVRPAHRGRGLARALLLACLDALRAAGLAEATLAVDTDNATGALRLYESCGFRTHTTSVVYLAHVG